MLQHQDAGAPMNSIRRRGMRPTRIAICSAIASKVCAYQQQNEWPLMNTVSAAPNGKDAPICMPSYRGEIEARPIKEASRSALAGAWGA